MSSYNHDIDMSEIIFSAIGFTDLGQEIANAYPSHRLVVDYVYSAGRKATRLDPEEVEEVELCLDVHGAVIEITSALITSQTTGLAKYSNELHKINMAITDYLVHYIATQAEDDALEAQHDKDEKDADDECDRILNRGCRA